MAVETEKAIDTARDDYVPIAEHSTNLFFLIGKVHFQNNVIFLGSLPNRAKWIDRRKATYVYLLFDALIF